MTRPLSLAFLLVPACGLVVFLLPGCRRPLPVIDAARPDGGAAERDAGDGMDAGDGAAPPDGAALDAFVETCETAGECAARECMQASCEDGACVFDALPDGSACDDADLCTRGDRCADGACEGEPLPCSACARAGASFFTAFTSSAAGGAKRPAALVARRGGGYAMAGSADGDLWIGAVDGTGARTLDRRYGHAALGDRGFAIARGADDGLVAGGYSQVEGPGLAWTVHVDAGGEVLEARAYFEERSGSVHGIVPLEGGALMAGVVAGRATVFRTASDGSVVWESSYFDAGSAYGLAGLVRLPGGDLALAGDVGRYPMRSARVVRIDADGRTIWDRALGGSETDTLASIAALDDGGVLVGGSTRHLGGGGAWLARLDAAGVTLWEHTYGDDPSTSIAAISPAEDGTHVLASSRAGDAWILRVDSDGSLLEEAILDLGGYESAAALHQEEDGAIVVAGWSEVEEGDETRTHAWILRSASLGGLACSPGAGP